ncbi:unnamed protein product [Spirodela intermedia]|uniref:MADS-box domain-containing protein n=1 Tax=Spirodela intermedia TaxID=51605 RepID=A0A7I8JPZ4_SPIIN|nr:unnamed protein product [Spirodela intermedia]CAA6671821.1 unnamed protein product [Spirodela intermedia]
MHRGIFIPRKKTRIRWLEDDARRRATLKKRRRGIIKKAEELHILCDVQTCVLIFSPNEEQPEVFPNIEQAVEMCRRFKQLPKFNRANLMLTNVQFIQVDYQILKWVTDNLTTSLLNVFKE